MSKRVKWVLCFGLLIIFAGLIFFFVKGLSQNPKQLNSMAEGKQIQAATSPSNDRQIAFQLPELQTGKILSAHDLPEPPYLINIWGTWCPSCHIEHPFLLKLSKRIPIIGINWPAEGAQEHDLAIKFLKDQGNPFNRVLYDAQSKFIIDLGVYGAPETFLIGKDHQIIKRYAGPLSEAIWQREFEPLLENGVHHE